MKKIQKGRDMSKRSKRLFLVLSLMVIMIFQPLGTSAVGRTMETSEEGWKVIKSDLNGGEFVLDFFQLGNTHSFVSGERNSGNSHDFFQVATGIRQLTYLSMDSMVMGSEEDEVGSLRVYLFGRSGKDLTHQKIPIEGLIPIDPTRPMVALTFDDGPTGYTQEILDILDHYRSRATFFVLGSLIEGNEDILRLAHDRGNEILGHSWSHPNFSILPSSQIILEITRTHSAILNVVGETPRLYRPPFGSVNNTVRQVSEDLGFSIINWTVDPRDWMVRDADRIYNSMLEEVGHTSIVVLHDTHYSTVEAMERVIPSLIHRGYQLVTISELFYYLGEDLEPGVLIDWHWRRDE